MWVCYVLCYGDVRYEHDEHEEHDEQIGVLEKVNIKWSLILEFSCFSKDNYLKSKVNFH